MNIKKLIAAVAVFAATGAAFAQQTEFIAPNAGFKSTLTRVEARQDLAEAARQGAIVQRQHDGQDPVYARSGRSRQEVRGEAMQSTKSRRTGDVRDLYFGA